MLQGASRAPWARRSALVSAPRPCAHAPVPAPAPARAGLAADGGRHLAPRKRSRPGRGAAARSWLRRIACGCLVARLLGLLGPSALGLCASACDAHEPPTPAPAAPRADPSFQAPDAEGWGSAAGLKFLELVAGAGQRSQQLPLVVMIHGMGDRPRPDWLRSFALGQPLRVVMPEAPARYFDGFSWFAYDVRGNNPPDALARGISRAAEQLGELIEIVRRRRPTLGAPIVVGFSQGGMLSYALALREPERLRLAIPISGLLPAPLWPDAAPRGARLPVRALHGTADRLVPIDGARALVQRMAALGYDAQLEEFSGVGHAISPAMQARVHALLREALQHTPR